jgi:hypothetical protein
MSWTVFSRTSATTIRPSDSSRMPLMQLNGSAYSRSSFEIVRSGGFWAAARPGTAMTHAIATPWLKREETCIAV